MANFFDTRLVQRQNKFTKYHQFNNFRNVVKHLHFDPGRNLLATVGQDNIIKLWNIRDMLQADNMSGP